MGAPISSTHYAGLPSGITSAMLQEHNLQALVELWYIRIGNEVMNSALSKLDTALQTTQEALNQLTSLQNLHNALAVTANSAFPLDFTGGTQTVTLTHMTTYRSYTATSVSYHTIVGGVLTTTGITYTGPGGIGITLTSPSAFSASYTFLVSNRETFVSAYQKLASSYYGSPIKPFFQVRLPATDSHPAISATITSSTDPAYLLFRDMLQSARNDLSALITRLSAITDPNDRTTLLIQLKQVRTDFPNLNNFSSVQNWVLDNYGGSTGASVTQQGKFQQNITNAITAAESTNTKQTEAVRRYMFVFEQYCQSAAAILNKLEQLFEKIARGISG